MKVKACDTKKAGFDNIAFIVGSGRSGSTLLKNLLDRHPDVATVPEFQFFKRAISSRKKHKSEQEATKAAARKLVKIWEDKDARGGQVTQDPRVIKNDLFQTDSFCELFLKASTLQATKQEFSTLVHKTPADIFFLPQIFAMFPQARVVHILRDGREVLSSATKRGWGWHSLHHTVQWQEALRYFNKFKANNPDKQDQLLEIKYEDLVHNHREVLERVFEHIGESHVPEDVYDLSDFGYSNTSFEGEDKSGLYHSTHFDEMFEKLEQEKINVLLQSELQEYGYEVGDCSRDMRIQIRSRLDRIKFRFYIWMHRAGYAHYHNKLSNLFS